MFDDGPAPREISTVRVFSGPDGREWPHHSAYEEVIPQQKPVFRYQSFRHHRVTVLFDDLGTTTRVSTRMVFDTPEIREKIATVHNAVQGQQQTLDRLEALVKRLT